MSERLLPIPAKFKDPLRDTEEVLSAYFRFSGMVVVLPWILSVVLLIVVIVLVIVLTSNALRPPSVITVQEGPEGIARGVRMTTGQEYLDDALLKRELHHFIVQTRRVVRDVKVNEEAMEYVGAHLLGSSQAFRVISEWCASDNGGAKRFKEGKGVEVRVKGVNRIGSSNAFFAEWQETIYDTKINTSSEPVEYSGTFVIAHSPLAKLNVTDDERKSMEILNPYGWFLSEVHWDRQTSEEKKR